MKKLFIIVLLLNTIYIYSQCWSDIVVGGRHTYGIKTDGTIWVTGDNTNGQLGDGTNIQKNEFTLFSNTSVWNKLSLGEFFSLGIKTDGSLWAWGYNQTGQLGNNTTNIDKNIPVRVGTDNDWIKISAGRTHCLALKSNGTLWSWGSNNYGELGDNTNIGKSYPIQVGIDNNWSYINAGYGHSMAIKNNGTLWTWGFNAYGKLGDNTTINKNFPIQIGSDTNWDKVYGGLNNTIALKSNGTLWSWGGGGVNGDGTNIARYLPGQIGTENNWSKISYQGTHVLAIKSNGSLWAWGSNNAWRLGDGTNIYRYSPVVIGTDTNWLVASASSLGGFSLAMKTDNSLQIWGYAFYGSLGNGGGAIVQVPTALGTCSLATPNFTKDKITIYPNPTKSTLNITTTTPLQKTIIYNLLGAKVYEQAFNESIDISSLSSGVYIVKFYSSDNAVFIEKFIKE